VLTASGSLDQETYSYPGKARISLTLKNTGSYRIDGIVAACGRSEDGNLGDGPGWGDLRHDGPGITLAPGESRNFQIDEDIPESARARGEVLLHCVFAPNAGWNGDGPTVSDSATVTGGHGAYKIRLAHDENSNGTVEPGEEVAGVTISLLDKYTGAVVAERTSGADGRLEFTGVPVGSYWARAAGSWMFQGAVGAVEVRVNEWGADTTFFVLPGVAAPQPRGTVRFDKSSYQLHETVHFWLTVTNIGGETAEGVKLDWPILSVDLPANVWGDFSPSGQGIRLAPGESRTFEGSGKIRDLRDGKLEVSGSINYVGRPNLTDSSFSGVVDVVRTTGELSGVVYTDKNHNRQQDPGEGAAGAEVWANGGVPRVNIKVTTDAEGRFSFNDLSTGDYYIRYVLAGGWIVHAEGPDGTVRVEPGAPVRLVARGERPYTESLSASLSLDKNVYQAGEEARITIKITNSSDREISGIQAFCHREGRGSNHLGPQPGNPSPAGWGDLVGQGVTVGPGETRTFIATENVPQAALTYGRVVANCGFSPYAQWNLDTPMATDSARVVGGFGVLKGNLFYDRNGNWVLDEGEGIGNTRIVLRDQELGIDVAETVSDDKGHVRFDRAPAGQYVAWVDGPWKFEDVNGHVQIFADREQDHDFIVVPDPRPGTGGGGTPPADGGSGSGFDEALARTGASVLGLGLVGALLVAFGFSARILGRRRTA
jgi:hypothetical protein